MLNGSLCARSSPRRKGARSISFPFVRRGVGIMRSITAPALRAGRECPARQAVGHDVAVLETGVAQSSGIPVRRSAPFPNTYRATCRPSSCPASRSKR